MTAAKNKPAGGAGYEQEKSGKSLYSKNIPLIYAHIKRLSQKWNMPTDEIKKSAAIWALIFRDAAPIKVCELFTGKPSSYSDEAKLLALAFYVIYIEATDRLEALKIKEEVDAAACWKLAIRLVGGGV